MWNVFYQHGEPPFLKVKSEDFFNECGEFEPDIADVDDNKIDIIDIVHHNIMDQDSNHDILSKSLKYL